MSTSDVRSELSRIILCDNFILVVNVTNKAWISYHLEPEIVEWLKDNM